MLLNFLRRTTCCALVQWIPITFVCAAMLTHKSVPAVSATPISHWIEFCARNGRANLLLPIWLLRPNQFNKRPIYFYDRVWRMLAQLLCICLSWWHIGSFRRSHSHRHFFRVSCWDYRSHTLRFDTLCVIFRYFRANAKPSMQWEPAQKRSPFNEWRMKCMRSSVRRFRLNINTLVMMLEPEWDEKAVDPNSDTQTNRRCRRIPISKC